MCSSVNDNYDGLGAEWLAQSGLLDDDGATADRSGQESVLDPVEVSRPAGEGEAEARASAAGSCSGECASCRTERSSEEGK